MSGNGPPTADLCLEKREPLGDGPLGVQRRRTSGVGRARGAWRQPLSKKGVAMGLTLLVCLVAVKRTIGVVSCLWASMRRVREAREEMSDNAYYVNQGQDEVIT
jgi:hypothetical protein